MRLRRSAEASELASRSAEMRPDDPSAQLLAGETLIAAQRAEEALPFLERAVALGSRAPSAYLLQTAALQERGRTREAIDVARRYLVIAPDDAMAWYNLGLLHTEVMQMDSAMRSLRKAIAIKPNYSEAYYILARVYDALGFSEDAIQTYRRCATTSAVYAGDSYHALALLYRKLGNFSEALRAHAQAIRITDTSQVYRSERLRTCFDADRCADAAGFIDRDVEQFPKSATVLYHAARCYLRSNRRDRAEQLLVILERIGPSFADDLKTLMRM